MQNLYLYDLRNRFEMQSFNVVEDNSLVSISIFYADTEKTKQGKYYGDLMTACLETRAYLLGVSSDVHTMLNLSPMLTSDERDKLRNVPMGLQIMNVKSSRMEFYCKRRWYRLYKYMDSVEQI